MINTEFHAFKEKNKNMYENENYKNEPRWHAALDTYMKGGLLVGGYYIL